MIRHASRLDALGEYAFSHFNREIALLDNHSKRKVLNFGPGTPDFPPSTKYTDKLIEFINSPSSHLYPSLTARQAFINGVSRWYKDRYGAVVKNDEAFPLLGAKEGISHLALTLFDEQTEVLVPNPGYPAFTGSTQLAGGVPVPYRLSETNGFRLNLAEIEQLLTAKTRFIFVNFPSNPTGQVITAKELEEFVAFCKKHHLFVIYDNAYAEITYGNYQAPSILQIKGATEIAVEIGSFSKMYSFAGYRMGWIVGNREVISAFAKLKSQIDSGMWNALQKLGAFVLSNEDKLWHQQMIKSYISRRDIVAKKLRSLGLKFEIPAGALYLWARIPEGEKDSEAYAMRMLREKHVFFAPGTIFGTAGSRFVRVSFCVNVDDIDSYLPLTNLPDI